MANDLPNVFTSELPIVSPPNCSSLDFFPINDLLILGLVQAENFGEVLHPCLSQSCPVCQLDTDTHTPPTDSPAISSFGWETLSWWRPESEGATLQNA